MTYVSTAAADAWADAIKPRPFWVIEHAASDPSEPLFYSGDDVPLTPWSVEKSHAMRFRSDEDAWDFIYANLIEDLVRARRYF